MAPADAPTPIQACLDRLASGDPTARNELVRVSRDRLLRLTRSILRRYQPVRRWAESDDVLQSALVRLGRTLEAVPAARTADFLSLAATNIHRELADLIRHYYGPEGVGANHATPGVGSGSGPLDRAIDGGAGPSERAGWREVRERIGRLPDDERTVFHLRFYLGLTHRETADALGVSEKTVKRRYLSGRLRLSGEDGAESGDFSDPADAPTPLSE